MKGLTIAKKLLLSYAVLVIAVSALSVAIVLPWQIRTTSRKFSIDGLHTDSRGKMLVGELINQHRNLFRSAGK